MFRQKNQPVIVPQAEHARLAGALAYHYGNDDFARPKIPFAAFVMGITAHDRGYGELDNIGVGEADEATWLAIQERGILHRSDNLILNAVACAHIQRLVGSDDTPEHHAVAELAEAEISHALQHTDLTREALDRADRVTNLCDMISFYFSFGMQRVDNRLVYATMQDDKLVEINYAISSDGRIRVSPWVFGPEKVHGFVTGYQTAGYPHKLTPVLLPYEVVPA